MRKDTPARRQWMLEHPDATAVEVCELFGITHGSLRQDEIALGIRLRRTARRERRLFNRERVEPVLDGFNPLADRWIRGGTL